MEVDERGLGSAVDINVNTHVVNVEAVYEGAGVLSVAAKCYTKVGHPKGARCPWAVPFKER